MHAALPPGAVPAFHLAQANVAYALAPIDDPRMADYVARLDELNLLADASPGFVWRFLTDSRDPADRLFDDPNILFNLSVWASFEALHAYTYRTAHAALYAARKRWFADWRQRASSPAVVLWWVPRGHLPTPAEAMERMALLERLGPTPGAFSLKQRFEPPTG
ncbi:MAG: DUF3291 domain-containing protein [Polyangiaceae bacterium]|jgi:hypothetical protein|nr:DUF3291 domain-containing protein [Polyangiaceae bacterium]